MWTLAAFVGGAVLGCVSTTIFGLWWLSQHMEPASKPKQRQPEHELDDSVHSYSELRRDFPPHAGHWH